GVRISAKGEVDAGGRAELRGIVRDESMTRPADLEIKGTFSGNMFKGQGRVGDRWADMLLTRSSPPRSAATAVAQAPAATTPPAQATPAPAPQTQTAAAAPAPAAPAPATPTAPAADKAPAEKPIAEKPSVKTAAAPPKPAASTTVAPAPVALTDKKAPVITVPAKLDSNGPVVELSGRVADDSAIVEFSINGQPVPFDANGRFSVRRGVPVGTSELKLAAVDEWGNLSEKTVAVTRSAPASTQTAVLPETGKDPAAAAARPKAPSIAEQLKGIKFGSYRAVVIGNNKYQHLQKLETATRDAQVVADILSKDYGFQVELLVDATRQQIMEALYRMRAELQSNDNLLVYYAGHGVVDKDTGRGYWLPVDAVGDIPTQWVPTTDLTDVIKAMRAKHIMVVADSCYSGALVRSATAGIRSAPEQDVGQWVQKILAKRSRTVLSSGGLEPVMDGGGEGHSVFAKAFIDALRDNDTVMDGQALFATIRRPIVLNSDQTPEYSDIRQAGHDGGDFLFVRRR
ncbi:MAG: caspase family protein, partial [Alphaproteobacteria bacterium]|nr:caspase family protein [Alphaproteobacteria bacterium]